MKASAQFPATELLVVDQHTDDTVYAAARGVELTQTNDKRDAVPTNGPDVDLARAEALARLRKTLRMG